MLRLFVPDSSTVSPLTLVIPAGAVIAMLRFKVEMGKTLLASAVAGLARRLLMGK